MGESLPLEGRVGDDGAGVTGAAGWWPLRPLQGVARLRFLGERKEEGKVSRAKGKGSKGEDRRM